MLRKICVLLVAMLLVANVQAQLPAGIDPSLIATVTTACGAGILGPALKYGQACLKGAQKAKKSCPTACKGLLAAVPNQNCVKTVGTLAQGAQAGLAKKMFKICKSSIAKIPKV